MFLQAYHLKGGIYKDVNNYVEYLFGLYVDL